MNQPSAEGGWRGKRVSAGVNNNPLKNLNESQMQVATGKSFWSMGNHTMHDNLPLRDVRGLVTAATWGRKLLLLLVLLVAGAQLRVLAQGDSVVLDWSPSVDTNVTGYNIYYGGVSGNYTNKVVLGNVTTATITGLTPGATYYFAATSTGAGGSESPFSNQTTYAAPLPVVLTMSTVQTQGVATAISITAPGTVSGQWRIDQSSDLVNWTPAYYGTNMAVNVSFPITSAPAQFFRLVQN